MDPFETWLSRAVLGSCLALVAWVLRMVVAGSRESGERKACCDERHRALDDRMAMAREEQGRRIDEVREQSIRQYADLKSDMQAGFRGIQQSVTAVHRRIDEIGR